MLPANLRNTLIIAIFCYFVLILIFLKRKSLELKYTLLWLFAGFFMGLAVVFPKMLGYFTRFLGIQSTMNGLYIVCIGFIIIILMALTSIVSKQTMKIRTLIQEIGMLEKRVRELETNSNRYHEWSFNRENVGCGSGEDNK